MERVKAEENISNVRAMSRLAELWKLMPEDEKDKYHDTAKMMKDKYMKDLSAYNNGDGVTEEEDTKRPKAKKGGKRK